MVFKRRNPEAWYLQLRNLLYPRTGWSRAAQYIGHRIKRLPDTPHKIALGFAAGVFVSFSPFFGLHFFYAALVALIIRGNVLAALIGTFAGNPLTFPFIATVSYALGRAMLGVTRGHEHEAATLFVAFRDAMESIWSNFQNLFTDVDANWSGLSTFFADVFWPYAIGGILPGLAAAIATYILSRPLIAAYQKRRRGRFLARAKEKLRRKKSTTSGA